MKIGTLTFHWATNYGAILQAYALQQYLRQQGYETEIVDYRPARVVLYQGLLRIRSGRVHEFVKELRLKRFRRAYLNVSKRTFRSNRSLRKGCTQYDVYIAGSDQVWNESFVLHAERSPTFSYYLDFVPDDRKRIAYATSFGADHLSTGISAQAKQLLSKFDHIGVRENTGKLILEGMGIDATVVVDPTLLMRREFYEELLADRRPCERSGVFSFILHSHQHTAFAVSDQVQAMFFQARDSHKQVSIGVLDWLARIRESDVVVTNSYHAVLFSIVFRTPFIAVPVEASGMNDRLDTLLCSVGLGDRIVDRMDKAKVARLVEDAVDWQYVDRALDCLREDAESFLAEALRPNHHGSE